MLGWGSVALVLLIWEVSAYLAGVSPLYLPRPSQIVVALVAMFLTGGLATDLGVTLYRIFAGFAIALVVGTLLGVWIATSFRVRAIADMFIAALYPLPKVTLIPLLDHLARHRRAVHAHHQRAGRDLPDPDQHRARRASMRSGLGAAARDLGATKQQIIRKVLIPSAIPAIFAGTRLGLGVSIILVVAAEMVVGKLGTLARGSICRARSSKPNRSSCRADRSGRARHRRHQDAGRGRHLARSLAHRLSGQRINRKAVK